MKNIPAYTDDELIKLFIAGDSNAFSLLLKRNKDKIFNAICAKVKDRYLADDIFQEVFIRVIDMLRANRYTGDGRFVPWVLRIAHNLCIDHIRKTNRSPLVKTMESMDDMPYSWQPSADDAITKKQTQDAVTKLVDRLPNELREVMILRHYTPMSFKQIASLHNCSINTALGRMRYGLINLRKTIRDNKMVLAD